ncbi:MAG: tryptophan--tRNA ligase [Nitrososphaerota archaeon]|nr:tryptophan--tRNA ligase [Candidatus Bathyarchaeota archaeon]MCX8161980.1 tryptophan--tRNA ligase [Candidatus Bathyarchaeota archaeon]MDW8062218.1 tryptophan--tRNA ligase [Nitrososphaerota archaeon]
MSDRGFVVTPWEVKGEVDYDKLMEEFGVQPIDDKLEEKLKRYTCGQLHPQIGRKVFFSHRDLDWILDRYEDGEKFFLYTGRGPSGHTHIGHIIPWIFTRDLQRYFDAEVYFQLTDDEKFLVKPDLSLEDTIGYAYDNALDVIACGFEKGKTWLFLDTEYMKTLYGIAVRIAKHITFSTVKAIFGFTSSTNIGMVFFPAIQAAPCFLPSILKGRNIPCLIPAAIDQDPYWRGVARAVAPRLGFYKPAQIHCKFLPGLGRGGKMSASQPETAIFTTDRLEVAEAKIMNAYTGGQPTVKEQRAKGGNPDICPIYQYYLFLFEEDDGRLKERYLDCRSGSLLCGDCKETLAKRVSSFLKEHQKRRIKAKNVLEDFILRD